MILFSCGLQNNICSVSLVHIGGNAVQIETATESAYPLHDKPSTGVFEFWAMDIFSTFSCCCYYMFRVCIVYLWILFIPKNTAILTVNDNAHIHSVCTTSGHVKPSLFLSFAAYSAKYLSLFHIVHQLLFACDYFFIVRCLLYGVDRPCI